ncbi:hypothetical protein BASA60_008495 [Batrachochytrium salamandrivorans]|nr:hypothetical protein BASA60_008495 [Batrachochytrium salamandrivorans]
MLLRANRPSRSLAALSHPTAVHSSSPLSCASLRTPRINSSTMSTPLHSLLAITADTLSKSSRPRSPPAMEPPASRQRTLPIRDPQSEATILGLRKEIKDLKRALTDSSLTHESKMINMERENNRLKMDLSNFNLRRQSLDSDCTFLFSRDSDLSCRIEKLQTELLESKSSGEKEIRRLESENAHLKEACRTQQEEADSVASTFQVELEQQRALEASLKSQLKTAQEHISEKTLALTNTQAEKRNYEKQIDQLKASSGSLRDLSNNKADIESEAILHKQLNEQATCIQNLEAKLLQHKNQIAFYQAIQENTERLKEEKEMLKSQVGLLDKVRLQLSEARVALASHEAERSRWQSFISEFGNDLGVDSPYAMAKLLSSQRAEIAALREKVGAESVHTRKAYTAQLEQEIVELQSNMSTMKATLQTALKTKQRADQLHLVSQKEIGFLRSQLQSYDMEEQSMMNSYDEQKSRRIADLETILTEYKSQNDSLVADLETANLNLSRSVPQNDAKSAPEPADGLQQSIDIKDLKHANEALKAEVTCLETQIGVLEHALGRGECDTSTNRILMLADNPESRAANDRHKLHAALAAENKELRMWFEASRAAGALAAPTSSMVAHTVPIETLRTKEVQCDQLQEELDVCNKRMMRLKEVFSTKIQEFREAVYTLLGFKVEIQMDGQVRLASMYAHATEDPALIFTSATNPHVGLQLLGGTEESRERLYNDVQAYVEQRGSVPALLAVTTLNWFERSNKPAL